MPGLQPESAELKGILLVLNDVPHHLEDEFNAWYELEHIPERLGVPGFETAHRYLCVDGWKQYVALYDLTRLEILESEAYARVIGANNSPWTKRVLSHVKIQRNVGVQLFPGQALTAHGAMLTLLRFTGVAQGAESMLLEAVRRRAQEYPDIEQFRFFSCQDGTQNTHFAAIESAGRLPSSFAKKTGFDRFGDKLDLVKTYSKKQ